MSTTEEKAARPLATIAHEMMLIKLSTGQHVLLQPGDPIPEGATDPGGDPIYAPPEGTPMGRVLGEDNTGIGAEVVIRPPPPTPAATTPAVTATVVPTAPDTTATAALAHTEVAPAVDALAATLAAPVAPATPVAAQNVAPVAAQAAPSPAASTPTVAPRPVVQLPPQQVPMRPATSPPAAPLASPLLGVGEYAVSWPLGQPPSVAGQPLKHGDLIEAKINGIWVGGTCEVVVRSDLPGASPGKPDRRIFLLLGGTSRPQGIGLMGQRAQVPPGSPVRIVARKSVHSVAASMISGENSVLVRNPDLGRYPVHLRTWEPQPGAWLRGALFFAYEGRVRFLSEDDIREGKGPQDVNVINDMSSVLDIEGSQNMPWGEIRTRVLGSAAVATEETQAEPVPQPVQLANLAPGDSRYARFQAWFQSRGLQVPVVSEQDVDSLIRYVNPI